MTRDYGKCNVPVIPATERVHSQLYKDKHISRCLTISETDVFWRENMQLLQCYTVHIAAVSIAAVCTNYTFRGEQ